MKLPADPRDGVDVHLTAIKSGMDVLLNGGGSAEEKAVIRQYVRQRSDVIDKLEWQRQTPRRRFLDEDGRWMSYDDPRQREARSGS